MPEFVNIAAYKFATLTDLKSLRERLINFCKAWQLRGTILLSTEGVNLFVAGQEREVELLLSELRSLPGLNDLTPKYSRSAEQPFTRMLVRIKKEIIAFGVPNIDPAKRSSPKLAPATLKQWLDEGRPVTLLDTRNDYEVKLGTFKGALTLEMAHFRQFPQVVEKLPPALKHQPVVMFCTGGIRCEKAGPFMERQGYEQVYQLEGGILKYFEDCGGDHFQGECFVFDHRVGVDPALEETASTQCYVCQTPLDAADQADDRYVKGESCPYCFKDPARHMAEIIAERHAALARVTSPLPGSQACANQRPLNIPGHLEGRTFLECLTTIFPHVAEEEWRQRTESRQFVDEKQQPISAGRIMQAGDRCLRLSTVAAEPEVNTSIQILHEDEAILLLNKPAPLPMHPGGRFNRNTLQFFLDAVYAPQRPRFVHRLDANTTGLVLCARTRHFAALLQQQLKGGKIRKTYLVRVHGHPAAEEFHCGASINSGPQRLGARAIEDEDGQSALTEFTVLRRGADGTSLLEARPITGRTHQIRLHLQHLGFPIGGDAIYGTEARTAEVLTQPIHAPPLCLHAWKLEFAHPITGEQMRFETASPPWTAA